MTPDTVLVLDFGAQYAQLIARRVRECHVYSEVVPCDVEPEEVQRRGAKALILSGGPCSVYEAGAPSLDARLLGLGIPVLGLCYGQQAMAQALGGQVEPTGVREYGRTDLVAEPERTEATPVAGFEDPARGLYGVQFHPEVAHTPRGLDLLKNFLYEGAGLRP